MDLLSAITEDPVLLRFVWFVMRQYSGLCFLLRVITPWNGARRVETLQKSPQSFSRVDFAFDRIFHVENVFNNGAGLHACISKTWWKIYHLQTRFCQSIVSNIFAREHGVTNLESKSLNLLAKKKWWSEIKHSTFDLFCKGKKMWETFLQLIAMTTEHPTRGFTRFWQPFDKFYMSKAVCN